MGDSNIWPAGGQKPESGELRVSLLSSQTTGDATDPTSTRDVVLAMDDSFPAGKKTADEGLSAVFIPPIVGENGLKPSLLKLSPTRSVQSIDGAVISFRDVGYEVQTRVRSRGCVCRKVPHHILKTVSGVFRPGVNAILGPTGSGKTTLLDILAGRKDMAVCSGDILVDKTRQPRNFKCMSGYVIQDDIVMGMLTVRENIEFSAALRLPSSMSASQRRDRVDELIADLGLTNCTNTKVGTEFVRGVSGGERKRTNIAMELITSPRVLFLDEPTTGLDANTAHSVMYQLQRLSRRGMTVILSIHQPRYSIYKLFDTLMLLSAGQCVFHGPAADGLDFFCSGNYVCEEHNNPPDFFLDVLNGSVRPSLKILDNGTAINGTCTEGIEEEDDLLPVDQEAETVKDRNESLIKLYQESKWHQLMLNELQPLMDVIDKSDGKVVQRNAPVSYATSAAKQMAVVSSRTWHNMVRNRHALLTQMFSAVILGLIVGSIYFQVDNSCKSGIQNRVGAFFFIVMNYVFGNMSAVDMFIKERALFM
jgi:ATP-binding cassette subfamily G (WHITE) protein 2